MRLFVGLALAGSRIALSEVELGSAAWSKLQPYLFADRTLF